MTGVFRGFPLLGDGLGGQFKRLSILESLSVLSSHVPLKRLSVLAAQSVLSSHVPLKRLVQL